MVIEAGFGKKAGKIEFEDDRKFSNGDFARSPILHRLESGEVEICKECNRKDRKFTNEELRGSGLGELEIGLGRLGQDFWR